jgi:hypothetical protein
LEIFLGGEHRLDLLSTFPFGHIDTFRSHFKIPNHPGTKGCVQIGHDVWIGSNVTLMSGISVGNGAVIAANSHVVKDVGSYEIWGGNPAQFLRFRVKRDLIERLNSLSWWDWCNTRINLLGNYFCIPLDENLLAILENSKTIGGLCGDDCTSK